LGEGEEEGDEVGWGTVGTYLRPWLEKVKSG
jgi:hypothetical protein